MKNLSIKEQKEVLGGKHMVVIFSREGKFQTYATFDTKAQAERYAIGVRKAGLVPHIQKKY